MNLKPNTTLQSGKYRIIRVLGQGGFGITYLAEHTLLDKLVAIKEFFPKDFCSRVGDTSSLYIYSPNQKELVEKLKRRFMKEAKNIAKLDHSGIIKIHDIFEENDTAYYVMDYIEGENLNDMVKRQGPLSEKKAAEYICQIGEALSYIHDRKMTHFDVKPANIIIRKDNDIPVLIDFGFSKIYGKDEDTTTTLLQGVSPGYSPIELYNPATLTTFSPQADVYSLGATFYYLIQGINPPIAVELTGSTLPFPRNISHQSFSILQELMTVSTQSRCNSVISLIKKVNQILNKRERLFIDDSPTPTIVFKEKRIKVWVKFNDIFDKETTEKDGGFTSGIVSSIGILFYSILLLIEYLLPLNIPVEMNPLTVTYSIFISFGLIGGIIYLLGYIKLCKLKYIGFKLVAQGSILLSIALIFFIAICIYLSIKNDFTFHYLIGWKRIGLTILIISASVFNLGIFAAILYYCFWMNVKFYRKEAKKYKLFFSDKGKYPVKSIVIMSLIIIMLISSKFII